MIPTKKEMSLQKTQLSTQQTPWFHLGILVVLVLLLFV